MTALDAATRTAVDLWQTSRIPQIWSSPPTGAGRLTLTAWKGGVEVQKQQQYLQEQERVPANDLRRLRNCTATPGGGPPAWFAWASTCGDKAQQKSRPLAGGRGAGECEPLPAQGD